MLSETINHVRSVCRIKKCLWGRFKTYLWKKEDFEVTVDGKKLFPGRNYPDLLSLGNLKKNHQEVTFKNENPNWRCMTFS